MGQGYRDKVFAFKQSSKLAIIVSKRRMYAGTLLIWQTTKGTGRLLLLEKRPGFFLKASLSGHKDCVQSNVACIEQIQKCLNNAAQIRTFGLTPNRASQMGQIRILLLGQREFQNHCLIRIGGMTLWTVSSGRVIKRVTTKAARLVLSLIKRGVPNMGFLCMLFQPELLLECQYAVFRLFKEKKMRCHAV